MPAMTSVIVEKCACVCFLTFYILQGGPSNVTRLGITSSYSLSLSMGLGAFKINVFKKLMIWEL